MGAMPWDQEIPPRILKLIDLGIAEGWMNHVSLAARFQPPSDWPLAKPFFARWDYVPETARWKFWGARVLNPVGTGLVTIGARDIEIYLKDPTVIYPENPLEEKENG